MKFEYEVQIPPMRCVAQIFTLRSYPDFRISIGKSFLSVVEKDLRIVLQSAQYDLIGFSWFPQEIFKYSQQQQINISLFRSGSRTDAPSTASRRSSYRKPCATTAADTTATSARRPRRPAACTAARPDTTAPSCGSSTTATTPRGTPRPPRPGTTPPPPQRPAAQGTSLQGPDTVGELNHDKIDIKYIAEGHAYVHINKNKLCSLTCGGCFRGFLGGSNPEESYITEIAPLPRRV